MPGARSGFRVSEHRAALCPGGRDRRERTMRALPARNCGDQRPYAADIAKVQEWLGRANVSTTRGLAGGIAAKLRKLKRDPSESDGSALVLSITYREFPSDSDGIHSKTRGTSQSQSARKMDSQATSIGDCSWASRKPSTPATDADANSWRVNGAARCRVAREYRFFAACRPRPGCTRCSSLPQISRCCGCRP